MTNNFIASAAEILAECLKMHSKGLENKPKTKNWADRARENLAKDNQFLGAITLINLLDEGIKKDSNLATNRTKAEKYLKRIFSTNRKLNMDEIKA